MSTLMIAVLLIAVAAGIPILLITIIGTRNKKRKAQLMSRFHEEGSKRGLSFSSTEQLKGTVIGFDGIKQSFLVYEYEEGKEFHYIDLTTVSKCTVKKETDIFDTGDVSNPSHDRHLRSVELCFEFNRNRDPISIFFYHNNKNSIYEISEVEARASYWETMVGKMIKKEGKLRA